MREVLRRERPSGEFFVNKVVCGSFFLVVRPAGAFPYLFACTQGCKGVNQKGELIELWREHDSTGLRAEPKLIHTAFAVRVARKHSRRLAQLPRRHTKLKKMGTLHLPIF